MHYEAQAFSYLKNVIATLMLKDIPLQHLETSTWCSMKWIQTKLAAASTPKSREPSPKQTNKKSDLGQGGFLPHYKITHSYSS